MSSREIQDEAFPDYVNSELTPIADIVDPTFDGLRRHKPRAPGLYHPGVVTEATGVFTGSETLVQQQFREETDINTIVRRFGLTGALPPNVTPAMYGDFTGITDFETAQDMVNRVREGFLRLPAELRERFGNDPARLADYVDGLSESELAAAFPARVEPVVPVEVATDAPSARGAVSPVAGVPGSLPPTGAAGVTPVAP